MISLLVNVDDVIPIFRTYLEHMSQIYTIAHVDKWCDTAVKNMRQFVQTKDQQIYIIKHSDAIIGFVQVNGHLRFNHEGRAIAEFHIQKEYEKKGYGRKLAEYAFDQFKGHWEVAVSSKNENALMFWKKVVMSYTSGHFKEKNKSSIVASSSDEYGFLFENR